MDQTLTLRLARPSDLSAVDTLLAKGYPRLLARDYPPSVMVLAVPIIARARPELLASGRHYVVEDAGGAVVGAGGWSRSGPQAHLRHLVTDPDRQRRGIGRAIVTASLAAAVADGLAWAECLATRGAVPFYAAMGFRVVGPVDVPLRPGIVFPAVRMTRPL